MQPTSPSAKPPDFLNSVSISFSLASRFLRFAFAFSISSSSSSSGISARAARERHFRLAQIHNASLVGHTQALCKTAQPV